jgi:hypothetical protein
MGSGLIELVLRYGRRVRLAWRVLLRDPENVAEQLMKPNPQVSGKSQPTGNHHARESIASEDGMVDSSKRDIHDALIAPRRHNSVGESDLAIERVNDFGALRGRQIFFR